MDLAFVKITLGCLLAHGLFRLAGSSGARPAVVIGILLGALPRPLLDSVVLGKVVFSVLTCLTGLIVVLLG